MFAVAVESLQRGWPAGVAGAAAGAGVPCDSRPALATGCRRRQQMRDLRPVRQRPSSHHITGWRVPPARVEQPSAVPAGGRGGIPKAVFDPGSAAVLEGSATDQGGLS